MAKKEEVKKNTEKKLYGAAAAAHAGVLYGAAKKSAEQRAAKLAEEKKGAKAAEEKGKGKKSSGSAPSKGSASSKSKASGGAAPKTATTSDGRKLYGAAAAAHAGVLYGAAKKSAEEREARLAAGGKTAGKKSSASDKSGSKSTARKSSGSDKKKSMSVTTSDGRKLYGAAAAAHSGVLYGAARKSAEERAAKLAQKQAQDSGSADGKSGKAKKAPKTAESSTGKKLYGAAAAAHAGVLYGAARKSAEARAARLAEEESGAKKEKPASKKTKKNAPQSAKPQKEQGAKKEMDGASRHALSWEEEEFLLNPDAEENGNVVDEALQAKFRKKIQDLLLIAKKKKNVLEFNEIKDYLSDVGLDDEHLERVLEIMESEGIDVLKTDEDLDEMPDDDEIMIEEEEEVDVDNIDLSVPDSVAIEDPVRMYLKEIGKVPLLSAEEEITLARLMETGLAAEKKLRDDRTKMTADGRKNVQDRIRGYEKERAALEKSNEGDELEREEEIRRLTDLIENSKKLLEQDKLKKKLTPKEKESLKTPIAAGEDAKNRLAEANLRLVVSIAKRYVGRGMLFLDLIQEGNLGLIKAVEKFDYRKGYKFSTYATWWIRQAITRAIADQARTIRIPVHMVETINKLIRVSRQLLQELGREPTPDEIAEKMNMPVERVREILKISQEPVSLETPIGEEEDSHLGDFIQDDHVPVPADAAAFTLLKEQLVEVLGTLTEREQKVLRLRFGLDDGRARTLEEVGREFNVTRERIRQIEAKALRKLRHPSRSRKLKDYLD